MKEEINLKGKYNSELDKINPNNYGKEKLNEANISIDLLSTEDKEKLGIELNDENVKKEREKS